MHYFKRNIGDYAKKAGRLSMLQHGAYTLLLDSCYDRERFPTLDEAIEWTWASTKEEIEAVTFVLRKFFTLEGEVYVQKRIQEEITEYHDKAETNRRIAIERETKRKEKSTNRAQVVNVSPPNQEPRTINQEPLKPKSKDLARGTRLPKDWFLPKEWGEWALKENSALTPESIRKIAEQFKDYWIAVSGHKGVKLDWCATWRNWIRKSGGLPQARAEKFDGLAYVMQFAKKAGERDEKVIEH